MQFIGETDGNPSLGRVIACSGLGNALATAGMACVEGPPTGSALSNLNVAASSTKRAVHLQFAPGTELWRGGIWTFRLKVTIGNANMQWDSIFVCRLTAGGFAVNSAGFKTGLGIVLNAGTYAVSIDSLQDNEGSATDVAYIIFGIKNTNAMSAQTCQIKHGQQHDTPIFNQPQSMMGVGT